MSKTRTTERKNDGVYFASLNRLVDELFKVAEGQKWTWDDIAQKSGLCQNTVYKLGMGITRYPQYRTVELLAHALGGHLVYAQGKIAKGSSKAKTKERKWILQMFSSKSQKNQKVA